MLANCLKMMKVTSPAVGSWFIIVNKEIHTLHHCTINLGFWKYLGKCISVLISFLCSLVDFISAFRNITVRKGPWTSPILGTRRVTQPWLWAQRGLQPGWRGHQVESRSGCTQCHGPGVTWGFCVLVLGVGSFPGGSVVEKSPSSAGGTGCMGSAPRSGSSPGEGNGNPLQHSCLENPMDRGAWQAVVDGLQRVDMTKQLCMCVCVCVRAHTHTHTHTHLSTYIWAYQEYCKHQGNGNNIFEVILYLFFSEN